MDDDLKLHTLPIKDRKDQWERCFERNTDLKHKSRRSICQIALLESQISFR